MVELIKRVGSLWRNKFKKGGVCDYSQNQSEAPL